MRGWKLNAPILLVVLVPVLSGCLGEPAGDKPHEPFDHPLFRDPFDYPSEPEPVEYTYIRIGQERRSGPGATYEGSLVFTYCLHNPNTFWLKYSSGWNIYQVMGPPNDGELRLVTKDVGTNLTAGVNRTGDPAAPYHDVYANETVEGNSTEYAIHLWHEILVSPDEAVHRVDRWFNMTFTPYGPDDTSHREGEPCTLGEENPPALVDLLV